VEERRYNWRGGVSELGGGMEGEGGGEREGSFYFFLSFSLSW